jgi:chemotaxis protein histidine kinase CheA
MATLREYFVSEADDVLARIDEALDRLDAGNGDANELALLARALRGSAHLARESNVYRAGLGLEAAARALSSGRISWNARVSGHTRQTMEDLYALVHGGEAAGAADARVGYVLERWRALGVDLPASNAAGASESRSDGRGANREFRQYAAQEISAIAAEIDSGLKKLAGAPRELDPVRFMLRRQRALLGSARLGEIAIVAETLHAFETLAQLIVKLNLPVLDEWFDALTAARDVLNAATTQLRKGDDPSSTSAYVKLRALHRELAGRYNESTELPAPAGASAPHQEARAPGPVPFARPNGPAPSAHSDTSVVPIEQLCFSGERALRRALELRSQLDQLADQNGVSRESMDELFDLIRLGIG